jgi:putative transposase
MVWGVTKVEDQRKQFILDHESCQISMSALCQAYEISRETGYKWLERFRNEGEAGLCDRNRARKTQAHQTSDKAIQLIIELKTKYPRHGAKKLKPQLEGMFPEIAWPSLATFNAILDKNGLVVPRKVRRRLPIRSAPLAHCKNPNDVWSADFKGWFLAANGEKCEPFTLSDGSSRFLLRCLHLCLKNESHVWAVLDNAFREYGLPKYLRTDNGPPFATTGAGRLSRLSVKLLQAGVIPDWIEPGEPQQNGRHERMHGTLQAEMGHLPNLAKQRIKLAEFREYYNFERPHEALGQKPPGSVYYPSDREWKGRLVSPEYGSGIKVGKVRSCGKMSFFDKEIYIARVLAGEPVGLKEIEEKVFEVYYGPIFLGIIDRDNNFDIPRLKPKRFAKV